jgi:hypothetical protein
MKVSTIVPLTSLFLGIMKFYELDPVASRCEFANVES